MTSGSCELLARTSASILLEDVLRSVMVSAMLHVLELVLRTASDDD